MKLQKTLTVLLSVSMLALLMVNPQAFGAPDPPFISGSTATFTGDQSSGIFSGFDVLTPPITEFRVLYLTEDITPATNLPGVALFSISPSGSDGEFGWEGAEYPGGTGWDGYPLWVRFYGGGKAIRTSGTNPYGVTGGITAMSLAGRGGGWGRCRRCFCCPRRGRRAGWQRRHGVGLERCHF